MSKSFIIYLTYAYNENNEVVIVNCHYTYNWSTTYRYSSVLDLLVNKHYDEFIRQCQVDNIIKIKHNSKFYNIFGEYINKLYAGAISFKGKIPEEVGL